MRRFLTRLLFLPTLGWNLLRVCLFPDRRWRDRIDEHVILGALPFSHQVDSLRREGVRAVVNTCAESAGPVVRYARAGIDQLRIPIVDFTSPELADIERALVFMRKHAARGESIYVHCKAGRGRSATVVLCWLMVEKGLTPVAAQELLVQKRPQVNRHLAQRDVVRAVYEGLSHRSPHG